MSTGPNRFRNMAAVCLLASIAGLAAVVRPSPVIARDRAFSPEAYLTIVNGVFIPNHWLHYVEPKDGGSQAQIVFTGGNDDRIKHYFEQSTLRHDIRDPQLWIEHNGILSGLDRTYFQTGLPGARRSTWNGDIVFEHDPQAASSLQREGGGARIVLAESPPDSEPQHLDLPVFAMSGDLHTNFLQLHEYGPGGPTVAVLRLIGQTPVVETKGASGVKVTINDIAVGNEKLRAIPRGGVVEFSEGERKVRFRRTEGTSEIAQPSLFHRWAPRGRNPDYLPLSEPLERAMNRFVASDDDGAATDMAVSLTLDPVLNREVQNALADFVKPFEQSRKPGFVAAVTVMDAKTGAILSLASLSTPPKGEVQEHSERLDENNANFRRLPIGSVAKVPFSVAIIDKNESLASLKVNVPAGEFEVKDLLGTTLPRGFTDDGAKAHAGLLGYTDFIAVSSDKYAAALLLLSAVPRFASAIPSGEAYERDGHKLSTRGLSIFERLNDGQPEFHETAYDPTSVFNWDDAMHTLFDVDYDHPDTGRTFNTSIWQPVYAAAPKGSPSAFGSVSPEQESFLMYRMHDFRFQALSMMLGSGEGRWTAIKVAQTFSRLVTGTKVSAYLASSGGLTPPVPAPLELKPHSRALVTEAMTHVVTDPSGTGYGSFHGVLPDAASRACGSGYTLGVFGKTGTPKYEEQSFSSTAKAINSLIRLGRLQLQRGRLVYSDSSGVTFAIDKSSRAALLDMLRNDGGVAAAINAEHVRRGAVAARLIAHNEHPSRLPQVYWISNGQLISVGKADLPPENHEGRAMAFTVALYPKTVPRNASGLAINAMNPPIAALSVMVNFSDKLAGGHMGARLSARLFKEIIVPRLLPSEKKGKCQ